MLGGLKKEIKSKSGYNTVLKNLDLLQNKLDEITFGHVFNSTISHSEWLKNQSFSPGRWAAGYNLLYVLYRIYNEIQPTSILEMGMGESSKLGFQYKENKNPKADYLVIEQSESWLEFFSKQYFDIKQYVNVLDVERINIHGNESTQYKGLNEAIAGKKFDLIIIDGPVGSKRYSRHQVCDIIEHNGLLDDFIIVIDDFNRIGEQDTAQDIRKIFDKRGIPFNEGHYNGETQVWVCTSPKYWHITSI